MLNKSRAIVLKSFKYGETGIIVQVYTEEFGRQSFIVHSVRKRKSKISYSLFETLSIINLDLYYKENRDIQIIKEAKPAIILHRIQSDIRRSAIALFIGEILFRTLKEIEPNRPLFDFLFQSVQILEMADEGVENYHLVFLLQFSKYLGIYPKNDETLSGIMTAEGTPFEKILNYSFAEMGNIHLDRSRRQNILKWLIDYYQKHLDGMGEIKSLKVLYEVFQ